MATDRERAKARARARARAQSNTNPTKDPSFPMTSLYDPEPTLGEAVGGFLGGVIPQTADKVSGMAGMLGDFLSGASDKGIGTTTPAGVPDDMLTELARGVGKIGAPLGFGGDDYQGPSALDMIKDDIMTRYGGVSNLKRTMANDPGSMGLELLAGMAPMAGRDLLLNPAKNLFQGAGTKLSGKGMDIVVGNPKGKNLLGWSLGGPTGAGKKMAKEQILPKRISITDKGLAKLKSDMTAMGQRIGTVVDDAVKAGKTANPRTIVSEIDKGLAKHKVAGKSALQQPFSNVKAEFVADMILDYGNPMNPKGKAFTRTELLNMAKQGQWKMLNRMMPNEVPVGELQRQKVILNQVIRENTAAYKYGAGDSIQIRADKSLLKGQRDALSESIPGLTDANKAYGKVANTHDVVQEYLTKQKGQQPLTSRMVIPMSVDLGGQGKFGTASKIALLSAMQRWLLEKSGQGAWDIGSAFGSQPMKTAMDSAIVGMYLGETQDPKAQAKALENHYQNLLDQEGR